MVASFNRLATMKIIPIIVLGFITFIFKNSLQSYDVMLIPPNFWDILHGNVTNVTLSQVKAAIKRGQSDAHIDSALA